MIRGFLIGTDGFAGEIEFDNDLHAYYELLKCDLIDIARRCVGEERKPYTFIVDDEGLLKSDVVITAFDDDSNPMLVGNLLIVNDNEWGDDIADLTDDDIEYIYNSLVFRVGYDFEADDFIVQPTINCNY